MDMSLLDAPNNAPATAASAPQQTIPVWLYRRCLYLLDVESEPDSEQIMARIRRDLLTQTGIRIPGALVRAITATYTTMNPYVRNRIFSFAEAQMRPAESDFQIQPVPSIRRQNHTQPSLAVPSLSYDTRASTRPSSAKQQNLWQPQATGGPNRLLGESHGSNGAASLDVDTISTETEATEEFRALNATQDLERMRREVLAEWEAEEAAIHMDVNAQVPGASLLTVDLELTGGTRPMNNASRSRAPSQTYIATPQQQNSRQPQLEGGRPSTQQYFRGSYVLTPLNYAPIPRQSVSYVRSRLPDQDGYDDSVPLDIDNDANAIRRQRYPRQSILLGLELPAPPSTAAERFGTQAQLRDLLHSMNAADDIGTPLEGEHVQPTDNYLSAVEQQPLLRDERGLINHATHDELQRRQLFQRPLRGPSPPRPNRPRKNWDFRGEDPELHYASGPDGLQSVNDPMRPFRPDPNQPPPPLRTFEEVEAAALREQRGLAVGGRAPGTAVSATTARPGRTQTQPSGRASTAARPRAPRTPTPVPASDRVTRSKRKREEEEEAAAEKRQREAGNNDESPPATKKLRLTLKINVTTGQITTGAGAQTQETGNASVEKKARSTKKANRGSANQAQATLNQPVLPIPRRLILKMPKPSTETSPTGKTRKRG